MYTYAPSENLRLKRNGYESMRQKEFADEMMFIFNRTTI